VSASSPTRPTGVTILAILAVIGGVLPILVGLTLLGFGGVVYLGDTSVEGSAASVVAWLIVLIGVASLIIAWGFWTLKSWAWLIGVILYAIEIVNVIVAYFTVTDSNIVSTIILLIVPGLILYYLFRPGVRVAFGRS
jgi:hypothetical protein